MDKCQQLCHSCGCASTQLQVNLSWVTLSRRLLKVQTIQRRKEYTKPLGQLHSLSVPAELCEMLWLEFTEDGFGVLQRAGAQLASTPGRACTADGWQSQHGAAGGRRAGREAAERRCPMATAGCSPLSR